jgi:hypothetical protein
MKLKTPLLLALLLTACATGPQKNILVDAEPSTPLDLRDLHWHCDLGDKAACALAHEDRQIPAAGKLAILQGAAPENAAVFSVLLPKELGLSWFVFDRAHGRLWRLNIARTFTRKAAKWNLLRLEVRNLEPNTPYELLAGDKDGRLVEERSFQTLKFDNRSLEFAVISGLGRSPQEEGDSILHLADQKNPAFFLWDGDSVNATGWKMNTDQLWERYAQARNSRAFFHSAVLRPIVAAWNELDFGRLDGDTSSALKDSAREVFTAFFPYLPDGKTVLYGPGTAKALVFEGQTVAIFDNRSFRTADFPPPACARNSNHPFCRHLSTPEPKRQHHFGLIQTEWLLGLLRSKPQPLWLVNGDSWFDGNLPLPSYEGAHPAEFADLLGRLEHPESRYEGPIPTPALIFLSPSHLAEIDEVHPFPDQPYSTYELAVPGAHTAFRGSLRTFSNPRRLAAAEASSAFLWLNSRPEGSSLKVKVSAISSGGKPLLERDLEGRKP